MTHADDSIVRVIADELEQKGFMNIGVFSEVECKKQDEYDIKCKGVLEDAEGEEVNSQKYPDLAFAESTAGTYTSYNSDQELTIKPQKDDGVLVCGLAPSGGGLIGALREAMPQYSDIFNMPTLKCVGL